MRIAISRARNSATRPPCAGFRISGRILLAACLALAPLAAQGDVATSLDEARRLSERGEYIAAREIYESLLRRHPGDWRIHHEAATNHGRRRRFREAVEHLRIARGIHPGEPRVLHDLASNLQNQGLPGEALESWRALESVLASNPDEALGRPSIPFNRGLCAEKTDLIPEAIECYSRAAQWAAGTSEESAYRKHLGALLFNRGDFDGAIREFDVLALKTPGDAEVHFFLGASLSSLGSFERAERHLLDARRIDSKDHRFDARLGFLYIQRKDLSKAITYLQESIRKNPLAHEPWYSLRSAYAMLGDAEKTEEAAVEYRRLRQMATDLEEELRTLRRRQKLNPRDAEAYFEEANLCFRQGRLQQGIERLQALLAHNPDHDLALLNLASALATQGSPQWALYEIEKILEREPGHPFANFSAAQLHIRLQQWPQAAGTARKSLERLEQNDPRRLQALNMLAFGAVRMGRQSLALPSIIQEVEAREGDPDSLLPVLDLLLPVASGTPEGAAAIPPAEKAVRSLGRDHPRYKDLLQRLSALAGQHGDFERKARYDEILQGL